MITSPKLSLIIPFYNERNIVKNCKIIEEFLKKNIPNYELIFVSDGSDQLYIDSLRASTRTNAKIKVIGYTKNQGRGYALTQGFRKATGEFLAYTDADLDISLNYLVTIYNLLESNDIVVANKFNPKSKINSPLKRRIPSIFFNSFVRLILRSKIHDHQIGLKGFRSAIVKKVLPRIKERGWLFDIELLYLLQKNNPRIAEFPIDLRYGYGKIRGSFIIDSLKLFGVVFLIKMRH